MKNQRNSADFHKRMEEAKARKKAVLEQQRLMAEFGALPSPLTPIIVKSEAEVKMDQAFSELKAKLYASRPPTQAEKIDQAIKDIARKAEGI